MARPLGANVAPTSGSRRSTRPDLHRASPPPTRSLTPPARAHRSRRRPGWRRRADPAGGDRHGPDPDSIGGWISACVTGSRRAPCRRRRWSPRSNRTPRPSCAGGRRRRTARGSRRSRVEHGDLARLAQRDPQLVAHLEDVERLAGMSNTSRRRSSGRPGRAGWYRATGPRAGRRSPAGTRGGRGGRSPEPALRARRSDEAAGPSVPITPIQSSPSRTAAPKGSPSTAICSTASVSRSISAMLLASRWVHEERTGRRDQLVAGQVVGRLRQGPKDTVSLGSPGVRPSHRCSVAVVRGRHPDVRTDEGDVERRGSVGHSGAATKSPRPQRDRRVSSWRPATSWSRPDVGGDRDRRRRAVGTEPASPRRGGSAPTSRPRDDRRHDSAPTTSGQRRRADPSSSSYRPSVVVVVTPEPPRPRSDRRSRRRRPTA